MSKRCLFAICLVLLSCQADPTPPPPVMDVTCADGQHLCPHGKVCTPDSQQCVTSVQWCADGQHWCTGGRVCAPDLTCVDRLSWCRDGVHWCSGGLMCGDDLQTCVSRRHDDGPDLLPVYYWVLFQ